MGPVRFSGMRRTLGVLIRQVASPLGGGTAFPALSRIERELRQCRGAAAAASVLAGRKAELCRLLSRRFAPAAAQALTLKILNLYLARRHFRERDRVLLSRPFGLVVDPSNVCELACPGCVHSRGSEERSVFDWPRGTLAEERFRALLRSYGPAAIGIYFCNYGEPLLNLRTPQLIRMAKGYLMSTALSTSLSVRRFDPDAYVESGLDFMVLSIDGATQPVYQVFRRNGNLELVLDNARRLVAAKRKAGRRTPVLSWNFLAFEHNAHEIPRAERMARGLGVDVFRVVNPFDVRWDDPAIRPAAVRPYVRRLDYASLSYPPENWNPFPGSLEAGAIASAFEAPWNGQAEAAGGPGPGHTCHWLYKNMVMDAGGRILPCCGAPRPDAKLVFGRFEGRDGDAFNTDMYRQARALFSAGARGAGDEPYCAQCEWDHSTVNIGSPEIRRYFRAADAAFFDRRSLRLLSDW